MTPRKELFIKIKEELKLIPQLELVDLQRKQFQNPKESYGNLYTAALIQISAIRWGNMVENKQEGECSVDIFLYTKDGWMEQHDATTDDEHGLIEIDLQDNIVESLHGLKGDYFKPLLLTNEAPEDEDTEMLSYRLTFDTLIYRRINPKYTNKKITVIP